MAIITALSLGVVVAGSAFAVEIGYDHFVQLKLQQAADAAAFGAAIEQRRGGDSTQVLAAATTAATQNGYSSTTDTLAIDTPAANSVRASLTRNEPRIFTQLFVSAPLIIRVNATATLSTAANACILALDPSASRSANFSGNSSTTLNNCVVMADSLASDAVNVQGSAQVTTPCLYAVGGVSTTSGAHMDCAAPETGQSPIGDPYKSLVMPDNTGPCINGNSNHLTPGRYCNGLSLHSAVTMDPGVYIISGGTLSANANADLRGTGVTIFLMNGAGLSFNGNAHFELSAPTTGPYAGFLFVGERTNTAAISINGDATSLMTGVSYFSNQSVSYLGNFSGAGGCTQIVAKTVDWSGSTSVSVDCSAYGIQKIAVGGVALTG